ncbi:MAG: signal recognition particle-docking protein FtsY [Planctomycetes bacterium]|nr:signal recognition particle-docking protein FtsY [Planctomycetota bacterium]
MFGKLTDALKRGLAKTRDKLVSGLAAILPIGRELNAELIDELEETLLTADIGPTTTAKLMDAVRAAWKARQIRTTDECRALLKTQLKAMLQGDGAGLAKAASGPTVILVAGVNGTGKTTSIAKLAWRLTRGNHSVVLAAADTFRAAAVDQLAVWSERIGCRLVRQPTGADPAAVAYDAVEAALARNADYLVIDTAGRLHTQKNLMAELEKIKRVVSKRIPGAPHETILVLDATTGQNAIQQALEFGRILDITGLFLTKLDGTAKGGAVIALRDQVRIPVKFIGVGEKPEDVEDFDAAAFVDGIFGEEAAAPAP